MNGEKAISPISRKKILDFQKRREKRLKDRGLVLYKNKFDFFRTDADGDEENNNNNTGGGGSHGNTRLPFGLCKRYGIEIGADWSPRDAWDALAGKGVTPDGAYERLEKGEDPATPDDGSSPPIEPVKSKKVVVKGYAGDKEYEVKKAVSGSEEGLGAKTWALSGDMKSPDGTVDEDILIQRFATKEEMYRFLKEQGVEEFQDPETGEIVNPKEMDLPPKSTWMGRGSYSAEYEIKGSRRTWDRKEPWSLEMRKMPDTTFTSGWASSYPSFGFKSKEDMLYWLRKEGVEEFVDPETGEKINPQEVDLPERTVIDGRIGYKNVSIGMRGTDYSIQGEYLDGRKVTIGTFGSLADAQKWLKDRGADMDKVKLSPALKKREAERVSWLGSDKTEYITGTDGKKYGDLLGEKDEYGSMWTLSGEAEDGKRWAKRFNTKAEMMKFMKEQGCEKVRIGKERINPTEYEVPVTVATINGQDFQEVGINFSYGDPYLYGIDLDGGKKHLANAGWGWTMQQFMDYIEEHYGLGEGSLTIDDETRQQIEARKAKDAEKEKIRKEFEAKAVTLGSRKVVDPHVSKDSDGDLRIIGKDKDGEDTSVSSWGSWRTMEHYAERFGVSLDTLVKDDLRGEYEEYKKRMARFETEAKDIEGYRVVDPYAFLDTDGTWAIRGRDKDDDVVTVTPWGSIGEAVDKAEKYGLDLDILFRDEKEKAEYEKFKETSQKFDREAVKLGDRKALNPHIVKDSDGTYQIRGTTRDGIEKAYSRWMDFYDLDADAQAKGYDIRQILGSDEMVKEYEEYKKAREKFDKEAIHIFGDKYVDCKVDYNPRTGDYIISGKDARGASRKAFVASDWYSIQKGLERYGTIGASIPLTPEAEERKKKALRAKELIDSGGWYSLGKADTAYTDISVEKSPDGKWVVKGKEEGDEEPKEIGDPKSSWDEAISEVEKHKVKDYKVKDGDLEIGKPKWGMHKVMLMRKPEGGYLVYADSDRYGTHAVMYEDPKEENARKWLADNGVPPSVVKTRGMNPNDDKPRTHTAKSLENFDRHRMERAENDSMIQNMSDGQKQETANMLTEMFDKGAYRMRRVDSSHFKSYVLDGFKNLLETGTSSGSSYKPGRRTTGERTYGHKGLKASETERYGYWGLDGDYDAYSDSAARGYGSMQFKFKKDRVQDRMTYTFGDTLDSGRPIAGYAGPNPTIEGVTGLNEYGGGQDRLNDILAHYRRYKRGEISFNDFHETVSRACQDGYVECQFHGPLKIEDVESIVMPKSKLESAFRSMSEGDREKVVTKLRNNDIKFSYVDEDTVKDAYDWIKEKYGV